MEEKLKQLLLKELCMRLPYKPKVKIGEHYDYIVIGIDFSKEKPIIVEIEGSGERIEVSCENVRLILRPLSSMTQKEKKEYNSTCPDWYETLETYQWCWKNNFDDAYLIPIGIAVEAAN